MRHFSPGLIFWASILTSSIQVNFGLPTECLQACPKPETIVVPTCNGTRIEPDYHEKCHCLLGYQCCPDECPPMNKTCELGLEIPVPLEDCCQCPMIRCDACPTRPDPECVPGCEELETLSDVSNGCHFKSCKVVCPKLDQISCPNCQIPEAFTNSSFCSCTQKRCVRITCPPKTELPPKECAIRNWTKTDCMCDKQIYDEVNYCNDHNAAAAVFVCKDKCFKSRVLQGKGLCGCNKPHCVQIKEVCLQTFDGWDCPTGTVKQTGTTPCGLERDLCINCDIIKFNNKTCDPRCYTVVQAKDVNGCPLERCERNLCPDHPPKNSSKTEYVHVFKDGCGCHSYKIVPVYYVSSQTKTWASAQADCNSRNMYLAVIDNVAEENLIKSKLRAVRGDYHWVGAKCKNSNYYYWVEADGSEKPFTSVEMNSGRSGVGTCDTSDDGLYLNAGGNWNDVAATGSYYYVCERNV